MFGKKTSTAPFPASEFQDRLDALIVAASNAGFGSREIANVLDQKAEVLRVSFACSAPVDARLY